MVALGSRRPAVLVVAGVIAAVVASQAPAASAAPTTLSVPLKDAQQTVTATYPALSVPVDTDLLEIALPTGFDWSPADLAAPAPTVTWAIESDGVVVGAASTPARPDAGTLATVDATGSINVAGLATALEVGARDALHVRAVWSDSAPADAGYVLDLTAPLQVVAAGGDGGDQPLDLAFSHALTEQRLMRMALTERPAGGDTLSLSTLGGAGGWSWTTGPDAANSWTSALQTSAGLGIDHVDLSDPVQSMTATVAAGDDTSLRVVVPSVVYAGVNQLAVTARETHAPSSGPVVTLDVRVALSWSSGEPGLRWVTAPVISGRHVRGSTLSAVGGTWTRTAIGSWAADALAKSFQWYRGSTPIPGAIAATHVIAGADVGTQVRVRVTVRSSGYVPSTVLSAPVLAVAPTVRNVSAPVIVGTARHGRVVTVRSGKWTPAPSSVRYQWRRDGVAIAGATTSSYRLPGSSAGHRISCQVSAVHPGYKTGSTITAAVRVR